MNSEYKKKEIEKIYADFKNTFESSKYKSVKIALEEVSEDNKDNDNFKHPLGKFVIFYSLPTLNPDVVIIGDNPSWFHKSDPKKAQENLHRKCTHNFFLMET